MAASRSAGASGGARVNTISPGIIITPLAGDELFGPRGDGYRRMIELSAVGRAGTPDEVGAAAALLIGPDGVFITGSDLLMDGGVTAAYWYGGLAAEQHGRGVRDPSLRCGTYVSTLLTGSARSSSTPQDPPAGRSLSGRPTVVSGSTAVGLAETAAEVADSPYLPR